MYYIVHSVRAGGWACVRVCVCMCVMLLVHFVLLYRYQRALDCWTARQLCLVSQRPSRSVNRGGRGRKASGILSTFPVANLIQYLCGCVEVTTTARQIETIFFVYNA